MPQLPLTNPNLAEEKKEEVKPGMYNRLRLGNRVLQERDEMELDEHCVDLVRALNRLPGITTFESCEGHCEAPYRIWFTADSSERGLLTLSRMMSTNYYDFGLTWVIKLDHKDTDLNSASYWKGLKVIMKLLKGWLTI